VGLLFVSLRGIGPLLRRQFLAAAAFAGSALVSPLSAAQIDRVRFDDWIEAQDRTLRLRGAGLYYYKTLIKAAAAALYLEERAQPHDVLSDVAKRLEMQYFWGVSARHLVAGSQSLLTRNLPADRLRALAPQIDAMHALYVDVAAGDRCALTYVPAAGTTLTRNGDKLGTVAGAAFAAAYFAIWFGEQPFDPALKRKLLGQ
jgi:hypothetical protein